MFPYVLRGAQCSSARQGRVQEDMDLHRPEPDGDLARPVTSAKGEEKHMESRNDVVWAKAWSHTCVQGSVWSGTEENAGVSIARGVFY